MAKSARKFSSIKRDDWATCDAWRFDGHGRVRLMAVADNYVMCRRPGCIPFVLSVQKWNAMSREPLNEQADSPEDGE